MEVNFKYISLIFTIRCVLPTQVRMWNDLPFTVFKTGTLDGFKGAVNRIPRIVFISFFRGAGACEDEKIICRQICFSRLGLCCCMVLIIIITFVDSYFSFLFIKQLWQTDGRRNTAFSYPRIILEISHIFSLLNRSMSESVKFKHAYMWIFCI